MIMNEDPIYWLWLLRVFGPCNARFRELLRSYECAQEAYENQSNASFARMLTDAEQRRLRQTDYDDCARAAEACALRGVQLIAYSDNAYPDLLRETRVPPALLFVTGDASALKTLCVAGVGTRRDTPYGREAVRQICEPVSRAGITLVSGLAYGTDAEVHRAALRAGGRTIAVLGNAIDETYPPQHRELRAAIERAGCAVSEYEPGTKTARHLFPQRNRIVAGLSRAVVIFEAARRSGTMITADWALGDGRDVFAVPGNITNAQSEGTNALLRQGASPITSAQDLLEAVGLCALAKVSHENAAPPAPRGEMATAAPRAAKTAELGERTDEKAAPCAAEREDAPPHPVASLLRGGPLTLDELSERAGMPAHALLAALTMLEIDGVVRALPGSRYALRTQEDLK